MANIAIIFQIRSGRGIARPSALANIVQLVKNQIMLDELVAIKIMPKAGPMAAGQLSLAEN